MLKRLVIAALFALTMIAPAAVTTAAHTPPATLDCCNVRPMALETYYYSDATKTVQVGFKYEDSCNHQQWQDGIETPYYTVIKYPCNA